MTFKLFWAMAMVAFSLVPTACSRSHDDLHAIRQEHLGKGIVVGSTVEQQKQQVIFTSWPASQTLRGQVIKIEGAAYVVRDLKRTVTRIPIDQYTTIDRPAHVGDWIEAYTDESGRALQVRNVDEEMNWAEE